LAKLETFKMTFTKLALKKKTIQYHGQVLLNGIQINCLLAEADCVDHDKAMFSQNLGFENGKAVM
jgi:hypothetical protein